MRIGELARRSGASVQTLRYYEREGILRAVPRTEGGYRVYSISDLEHVTFVRNCQGLGFSLDDIRALSILHGMPDPSSRPPSPAGRRQFVALARARLCVLDKQISGLNRLRAQIAALLASAESAEATGCPAAQKSS